MATATKKPKLAVPVVYYDTGEKLVIGPFGYWRPGDELKIKTKAYPKGTTWHVTVMDADGLCVAFSRQYLDSMVERGEASDLADAMNRPNTLRGSTHGESWLNQRQREQCAAIRAKGAEQRKADEGA